VIEMEVCDVTGVTCWEYKKGVFVFVSVVSIGWMITYGSRCSRQGIKDRK